MTGIAHRRSLLDILLRLFECANSPIADVTMEIGIIEQLENEGGVGDGQFTQYETGGGNHGKGSLKTGEVSRVPPRQPADKQ